jgi:hypothetical protein
MMQGRPPSRLAAALAAAAGLAWAATASAAPDEIQVYIDTLLAPGEKAVELHMNYVPKGATEPEYPGQVPPNHVFRITPEISWGLAPGWDMGLYIPFSYANNDYQDGARLDGAKLRLRRLWKAEGDGFFYGVNVELAYGSYRVSPNLWRTELRGIVGWRGGPWLVSLNPIVEIPIGPSRTGDDTVGLALNAKLAYAVHDTFAIGIEQYSDLGAASSATFGPLSGETTFAVVDYAGEGWGLNFGVGRGWTDSVDTWVVKAIVGFDF